VGAFIMNKLKYIIIFSMLVLSLSSYTSSESCDSSSWCKSMIDYLPEYIKTLPKDIKENIENKIFDLVLKRIKSFPQEYLKEHTTFAQKSGLDLLLKNNNLTISKKVLSAITLTASLTIIMGLSYLSIVASTITLGYIFKIFGITWISLGTWGIIMATASAIIATNAIITSKNVDQLN
jgi:hypothetical protein